MIYHTSLLSLNLADLNLRHQSSCFYYSIPHCLRAPSICVRHAIHTRSLSAIASRWNSLHCQNSIHTNTYNTEQQHCEFTHVCASRARARLHIRMHRSNSGSIAKRARVVGSSSPENASRDRLRESESKAIAISASRVTYVQACAAAVAAEVARLRMWFAAAALRLVHENRQSFLCEFSLVLLKLRFE